MKNVLIFFFIIFFLIADGDNPELADFLEDVDELERADNLNEFLLGYDATDEARICQFSRKDGTCFKGKHCKLEHIQLKGSEKQSNKFNKNNPNKTGKKKKTRFVPLFNPG